MNKPRNIKMLRNNFEVCFKAVGDGGTIEKIYIKKPRRMRNMSEIKNGTVWGKANLHFETRVLLKKSTYGAPESPRRMRNKSNKYTNISVLIKLVFV